MKTDEMVGAIQRRILEAETHPPGGARELISPRTILAVLEASGLLSRIEMVEGALRQASHDLRFAKREFMRSDNKEAARYMDRGQRTCDDALGRAALEGMTASPSQE